MALVSVLWLCSQAWAVLGGDVSSIRADEQHFQASAVVTRSASYNIHEMRTAGGASIREYVSPAGRVFAVAWSGPAHPDLKQLLGEYFEEFQQAAESEKQRGVHGPMTVRLPSGLVVELGGHMRALRGRAYLTEEMPGEVRAEAIR